mgnify:CR=1 FL=1|tara:strand:- start:867 stop:2033 length:1167 start_codon:yes stop_codon:yes gene_type:complete
MKKKINFLLSCSAKHHYFEIAKILYQHGQLKKIISGYPWFKLKDYQIKKKFVSANGFYRILRQPLLSSKHFKRFDNLLMNLNYNYIDNITVKNIKKLDDIDVLLSFAGVGLKSGSKIKEKKKIYICDNASPHVTEYKDICVEEYKLFLNREYYFNKQIYENRLSEYDNADIILTSSTYVKKTFEKYNHSNLKMIELGTNPSMFFPFKEIKKDKNYFDIIYIGRLTVLKGLHYLLDAFKNFKHPKKRLHIIGTHTEEKEFFENKLKSDDIFLYGHVNHHEINKILNNSDVIVFPSLQDGWGLAVTEAAAAGCPSIVSENSGVADFVKKSESGFIIPIRNSNSILEKLQELSDNRDLLYKMSSNALKFSNINTWENYVSELNELIHNYKT